MEKYRNNDDPQAEIALKRLNNKKDKVVSMKAMERAVKNGRAL